jgi:hypothetical protein
VRSNSDGRHYWLTPPELFKTLDAEFAFDFDPCPFPQPEGFDGLAVEWGMSNYVNPPFYGGPTAWVRKALVEREKGKRVILVFPVDKWLMRLINAADQIRDLGDVRWRAIEDQKIGPGTGRYIACFVLEPKAAREVAAE